MNNKAHSADPLLDVWEVAEYLGMTEAAVRRHIRDGVLPVIKIGGQPKSRTGSNGPRWTRSRRFRPATVAVGLGSVRLHDLRHTFASLAASRGVPSPQVAEWLGHSNDVITRQIYTHLFATDTALNVARLAGEGRPNASSVIRPISRLGS